MDSKSSYRLCISNVNAPGVLGKITTLIATHNCNIIRQNNTKANGDLALSVIDLSSTPKTLKTLLQTIKAMPDVVSCNLGHFDKSVPLSTTTETFARICIVNENRPGVLAIISNTIGALALNIASQRNRSHGKDLASTVIDLDIDVNDARLSEAALQIATINGVLSADVGEFSPGSLTKLRQQTTPKNSINEQIPLSSLPLYNDTTGQSKSKSTTPKNITTSNTSNASNTSTRTTRSVSTPIISTSSTTTKTTPQKAEAYYNGGNGNNGDVFERRTEQLEVMSRRSASTLDATQLLLVMVGLPARGKSFTARKLASFLNWGTKTRAKVFNAGQYRRKVQEDEATESKPPSSLNKPPRHRSNTSSFNASQNGAASFFAADNTNAKIQREAAADLALTDILTWFFQKPALSSCAIFDATNSTRSRRHHIVRRFQSHSSVRVIFIEVICDDQTVLNENILHKVRCSPDFHGMSLEDALFDFKERISNYTKVYDSIDKIQDRNLSYIQLENMGNSAVLNKIYGRMTTLVLPYLMALHVGTRPIWLLCVDEYDGNEKDGNEKGKRKLKRNDVVDPWQPPNVGTYLAEEEEEEDITMQSRASLLSEWLRTAIFLCGGGDVLAKSNRKQKDKKEAESSELINLLPVFTSSFEVSYGTAVGLNEMLSVDDANQYRIVHKVRDVLRPQSIGKTDRQLCGRLSPMAIELEQQTTPTLVIAGSRVIKGLMSYFLRTPVDVCTLPRISTIVELMPSQGGTWQETMHHL